MSMLDFVKGAGERILANAKAAASFHPGRAETETKPAQAPASAAPARDVDEAGPAIANYIDALYFTVTTLTTTGFGDITLQGSLGRLISIVIMIFGVTLFLRLLQALVRPHKVRYPCPTCGLQRYEADAVLCAKRRQKTPDGYYNLERMLKGLGSRNAAIGTCASCMDARGLTDEELLPGVHRSSMDELTDWTVAADKVIVF